ncbi:SDR family NAD(P)-dependent oxidoreductase [Limnofasciculus baicalensis]|uniref:SDR family NAD(P)-dependent oxidoreductase n=1 Tax=Limnofasciculus baicalensis BBK-W-15 TaxID=2699891 RepID=A0AAE3GND7_9CYAN|nr:SDR family NAD(P)-dependent oxidoreductase [Limnofasciculus baicalensis]MCP2727781.1 SDR family NAD(P)-dependent oxidoreductase [Limnofasciculus baicalensis BBK-W-15]
MSEQIDLSSKNILITGGSMGLGYAAAEACLQANGRVVICARNQSELDAAVNRLKAEGYQNIVGIPADVTKQNEVELALNQVESQFGPLNAVIHAAGIYGPIGTITDVNPQEWFKAIEINLFGTFLVLRQSCLYLKKNGGGRIALFSGGGAASPFPNYTGYACSKIGVVRLTETTAIEMTPHNIEINCIAPGFVITRLHQQTLAAGKLAGDQFLETTKAQIEKGGVPASVGGSSAAFLISDQAKGITGKFVAAPYDGWKDWPEHLEELKSTDIFTLRRIIPKERGMDWQ